MGRKLWAALAVLMTMLALAGGAAAITGGQLDSSNTYSNVGALYASAPGHPLQLFCSGTLVKPGVFLTAAHCIAAIQSVPGPQMYVTFAWNPGPSPRVSSLIPVTSFVVDPQYAGKRADANDIAVLYFDASRASGITPVTIAPANYLDTYTKKALRTLSFLDVGYGLTDPGGTPDGLRRYAYSGEAKLKDENLVLSQKNKQGLGGTCYGDSGGPAFLDGYQVAITITGDRNCITTGVDLRLDSGSGRAFLQSLGIV
jgi:secreted trypsin-like serine protease